MTDLFDGELEPSWADHWKNMPEYVQGDLSPYRVIYVRFRNEEDVKKFEQLMEQKITENQKTIWYPYAEPRTVSNLRYVDES